MSWSLFEAVAHDAEGPTSRDWSTYPIARFPDIPERLDVHLIDRPASPSSAPARSRRADRGGAGQRDPAGGGGAPARIADAVEMVKAAIGV